jgi:outer membrane autotransporter protein
LGGEIYADTLTAGRDSNRAFLGALDERLMAGGSGPSAAGAMDGSDPAVWGQATGRFAQASGDGSARGFTSTDGGVVIGASASWGAATAGAAFSYDHNDMSLHGLPQSANLDTIQGALYGEANFGMGFIDAAGSIGSINGHGERSIVFPGVSRRATGDLNGMVGGVMANIGLRFRPGEGWMVEPSAGLLYSTVRQGSFRESGAGGADLAVRGQTEDATESLVGLRISKTSGPFSADLRVAWAHEFSNTTPRIGEGFAITPGANFVLAGDNTGGDAALITAGVAYAASSSLSLFATYNAQAGNRETDQTVNAGLRFRW